MRAVFGEGVPLTNPNTLAPKHVLSEPSRNDVPPLDSQHDLPTTLMGWVSAIKDVIYCIDSPLIYDEVIDVTEGEHAELLPAARCS